MKKIIILSSYSVKGFSSHLENIEALKLFTNLEEISGYSTDFGAILPDALPFLPNLLKISLNLKGSIPEFLFTNIESLTYLTKACYDIPNLKELCFNIASIQNKKGFKFRCPQETLEDAVSQMLALPNVEFKFDIKTNHHIKSMVNLT